VPSIRPVITGLLIAALLLVPVPAAAQNPEGPAESDLKAALIFSFAKFVTWPEGTFESSISPIVIGVYGGDPIRLALEEVVRGREIDGRPLVIKPFVNSDNLNEYNILFIHKGWNTNRESLREMTGHSPILTVSDVDQFVHEGGMVSVTIENERPKIEINIETVHQARLRISSKLLRLAHVIGNAADMEEAR